MKQEMMGWHQLEHMQIIYTSLQADNCTSSLNFYSTLASAVLATAILSVCLSVTRWYCVKMTARSTVQFALSDSKMCLVL